jgi:hypothetical protein
MWSETSSDKDFSLVALTIGGAENHPDSGIHGAGANIIANVAAIEPIRLAMVENHGFLRTWAEPADRDLLKTSKGTAEEQAELSLLGFEQIEDDGNIVHYCHATSGLIIYLYSNNKWWCKNGTPDDCKAEPDFQSFKEYWIRSVQAFQDHSKLP